jgi:16S rRNA (cytidine1402-2'-O)-methyltransferase
MAAETGILYVVATPIGNLQDMSARAVATLKQVARIAAEDTRHSHKLLSHYGIATPLLALHEHNEATLCEALLAQLHSGADLALISDAGTPLISDPGFRLVRAVRADGIRVVPVPGPSAGIAALSASGLPTDRFVFEGFLPARQAARRRRLQALCDEPRTLVFYESSHRICECLADMVELMGPEREAVVARELTKTFETIQGGTLASLREWLHADANHRKGEFVVLVHGLPERGHREGIAAEAERVLAVLCAELPLRQAASLTAKITGLPRNRLYAQGLALKPEGE